MEEERSKAFYLEEIEGILPCSDEEMEELFSLGTKEAEARLIEGNLFRVKDAASYFANEDLSFMDLVQEGNLALMLEIRGTEMFDERTPLRLNAAIREAMQNFADEEDENNNIKEQMAATLNVLDEVCVSLAEEFGRQPTTLEIAEKMKMEESDIKYLMEIALDAMTKNDATGVDEQ